jgi:hypothetical protein
MTRSLTLSIISMIIIISDIVDRILINYLIQNLVEELGQVESDPGEARLESENPEEPGPGGESELLEDSDEFDVVDEIDDD